MTAVEGLVAHMQPGDKTTGNAYLERLKGVRGNLEGTTTKQIPAYNETVNRYNVLNKKIVEVANAPADSAPATTEAPATTTTTTETPAAAPADLSSLEQTQLKRVQKEKGRVADAIERADLVALQGQAEQDRLRGKIEGLRAMLAKHGRQDHPDVQAEAGEIAKLDGALDQQIAAAGNELTPEESAAVEAAAVRIDKAWKAVKGANPGILQPEGEPVKWNAGYDRIHKLHAELPKQDHPRVKEIGGWLAEVRTMLDEKLAYAEKLTAEYCQILARFDSINGKYIGKNLPDQLDKPLTEESTRVWVETIVTVMGDLDQDAAWLESVKGLNIVDQQKLGSAIFWVGTNARRDLQKMLDDAAQFVDSWAKTAERMAAYIEDIDVNDRNDIANKLLGEGQFEETIEGLQNGLHDIAMAKVFEDALGQDTAQRDAQRERHEAAQERFEELVQVALNDIRMPQSRSDDDELLEIAAEVLKDPKHGVNPYQRMVVSYDVHRKEKREGYIDPGAVYTTISIYHYEWDEYNVTTAEQVGDKYFMFVNKLKYFLSGDATTPTGRWILSTRFQSSQILEENIDE